MLKEVGFGDIELVGETSFNSSPVTIGVLFRARKQEIVVRGRGMMKSDNKTGTDLDFQSIYKTFHPKIVRYLAHMVGWRDAEDVTQEVFVKVNQGLSSFKGESQVSTWIYRIATHSALDKLRSPSFRQTGRKSLSGDSIGGGEIEIMDKNAWTGENTPSIETSAIRTEMNQCIRGVVEKLPESYRTVVVLSELEGFRDDEIAEILGVSIHTAKIRLHRARARLKKDLEAHCNFYRDDQNEFACDLKGSSEPEK